MFNVLLVDDEPLALQHLQSMISVIPNVEIVGQTTDGSEVLHLIKQYQPNLVFLDIHIGTYNGLEIAEQIELLYPTIQIVFVTAYTEHAVQAFELNAIDYLLKPVSNTRLVKTFSRLSQKNEFSEKNIETGTVTTKEDPHLKITAFKQGKIETHTGKILSFRTKKAEELLFLLWHFRKTPLSREQIIEALWPDSENDKSTTLLHSTLYQLRKTLTANGFEQPILLQNKLYSLQTSCESDVEQFITLINQPLAANRMEELMAIYQGPYFEQNEFEWSQNYQKVIEQKWMDYTIRALEKVDQFPTPLLSALQSTFPKDALYNEEWIAATLRFFGETKQMKLLTETFEEARDLWINELGLDLSEEVIQCYSTYLNR